MWVYFLLSFFLPVRGVGRGRVNGMEGVGVGDGEAAADALILDVYTAVVGYEGSGGVSGASGWSLS